MHKASSLILGAICALALVGCGGGSGSTALGARNPRVRVVNAISDPAQVDVTINNQKVSDNAAYGSYADYTIFENGDRRTVVTDSTTGGVLYDNSLLFELGQYYTVVPYRTSGGAYQVLNLKDVPTDILNNQAQIRVVNVSNNTVDVYIHPSGTSISSSDVPTISALTQGDDRQGYTTPRDAGTYTVTVTATGTQTVLYERDIAIHAGEVETAIITGHTTSGPNNNNIIDLPSRRF